MPRQRGEHVEVSEHCISSEKSEVCSLSEWGEVLSSKINSVVISSNICIGTKLSLYRLILLRILKLSSYKLKNRIAIWAVTRSGLISDCAEVVIVDLNEKDWFQLYSKKLPGILALPLSEPLRVLIFTLVGASGIFVNLLCALATYNLLFNFGYIANPVASTAGFETSVLWNFTLHEKITFRGTSLNRSLKSVLIRLVKYHFVSIGSWVTQVTLATMLPILLHTPFWLAQLTGILLGFIVNFIFGYIYTWSKNRIMQNYQRGVK